MKIVKKLGIVILALVLSVAVTIGLVKLAWFLKDREQLMHEQEVVKK